MNPSSAKSKLSGAPQLKSERFKKARERAWFDLDEIVSLAEKKGLRKIDPADLERLPILYRTALSSLSVARSISLDRNLIDYLETLTKRAYFIIYSTPFPMRGALWRFFSRKFPATVRRYHRHLLISAVTLFLGVCSSFFLTIDEPERFYNFVSEDMASGRTPHASTESLRSTLFSDGIAAEEKEFFAAQLMTHNTKVGFLAFTLGVMMGLPTLLLLFKNGLTLGALAGAFHLHGLSIELWGWLLPHGVTELLAIVLCGAAGLILGESIIFPGRARRLENLARKGKDAGVIVLGSILLFFIAGLIEGIFRQTVLDTTIRYSVAGLSGAFWLFYFLFVGRSKKAPKSPLS